MIPTKEKTFIITYTGQEFYPFFPRPEDVDINDIAHSLSGKCRWNGHCRYPYLVGSHSIQVARRIKDAGGNEMEQLAGLLHDGSEAYFADVPTPIKKHIPDIISLEDGLQRAIELRFGLPKMIIDSDIVAAADRAALLYEARTLQNRPPLWALDTTPIPFDGITAVESAEPTLDSPLMALQATSEKIHKMFLDMFFQLGGGTL